MTSNDDFDAEFRRVVGREFGHDGRSGDRSPTLANASLLISVVAIVITLTGPLSGLVTLGGLFIPVGIAGMVAMIFAAISRHWLLVGLGAITAVFPLLTLLVISEAFGFV